MSWPESTHDWTWRQLIAHVLEHLGGTAKLSALYRAIETHPKARGKKHWQARIRGDIEGAPQFVRVENGVWAIASDYSEKEILKFQKLRTKQHPKLGPRKKKRR